MLRDKGVKNRTMKDCTLINKLLYVNIKLFHSFKSDREMLRKNTKHLPEGDLLVNCTIEFKYTNQII